MNPYKACQRAIISSLFLWPAISTIAAEPFRLPYVATTTQVQINTYGIHQGNQVVYRYQVVNNSGSSISGVELGLNRVGFELPGKPWSLDPRYSDIPVMLDTSLCKPFFYMTCSIAVFQFDYMTEPKSIINMTSVENSQTPPPNVFSHAHYIRPGTVSSVAELYVPAAYQSLGYLTASGEIQLIDNFPKLPDGTNVLAYEVPFTKIDVTPPTLTVTLSPTRLKGPDGKLANVTATITVNDNYDPAPEIKLESITANEPLAAGDIGGATFGADDRQFQLRDVKVRKGPNGRAYTNDRQFQLRDVRVPKGSTGRVYTITYSATDGSGNKATASATVSVK